MAGEDGSITEEQRKRMEQNRKRALEIRSQKLNEQSKRQNTTPVSGARNGIPGGQAMLVTPPVARIVSKVANPYAARSSNRHVATPLQSQHRHVGRVTTPTTVASRQPQQPMDENAGPCGICGQKCRSNELCIRWWHTSQLNRSGRHSCCGRLKGQPCYVGRHVPLSNNTGAGSAQASAPKPLTIQCRCRDNLQARIRRMRQNNMHQGRLFFQCSAEKRPRCKYFQYVDELFNVQRTADKISSDGVKEWECPFAFLLLDDQNISSPVGGENNTNEVEKSKRESVIMALFVSEMFKYVLGQHGWSCSSIGKETLISRVMKDFNDGNYYQKLRPLSYGQVNMIFGLSDNQKLGHASKEECALLLDRLMQESSFVRNAVFPIITNASKVEYDLSGLEAFINI